HLGDLFWQNDSTGELAVWNMNGSSLATSAYVSPNRVADPNWKVRGVGDVNLDGKPDLVWQNDATGQFVVWYLDHTLMFQSGYLSTDRISDTNWKIATVSDLNGDAKPDLVFRNKATGELAVWLLSGTT